MAPKQQAKLKDKGKSKHSVQPGPLLSPCTMNSVSSKRGGTKCRKSKRGSSLVSAQSNNGLGETSGVSASETTILSLPSTSSMAFTSQTAVAASCADVGPSLLEATAPLSDDEGIEQEEIQRDHSGEPTLSVQTRTQSGVAASAAEVTSEVDPIELDASAVEEVVDLTCESSESAVVDLTHNDSVVCVEENLWQNQELGNQLLSDSCILSSDDDSEPRERNVLVSCKLPRKLLKDGIASSKPSGIVNCPICMDDYSEIVHSGRLIVSTKCGHIFCSQCLRDALKNASSCPTCRKKLNHRQYHPIYI